MKMFLKKITLTKFSQTNKEHYDRESLGNPGPHYIIFIIKNSQKMDENG